MFLNEYPLISTYLANLLITRTLLFIGNSLDDSDFKHIWKLIKDRLWNLCRPSYTFPVNADQSNITKLNRRDVKVINLPGRIYLEALVDLF